jgi:hypothetical protein
LLVFFTAAFTFLIAAPAPAPAAAAAANGYVQIALNFKLYNIF